MFSVTFSKKIILNNPFAHKGYKAGGIQANKVPKSMHFRKD